MTKIFKFKLNETLPITSIVDRIVEPLKVDYQNGVPYLWAIYDDDASECNYEVYRIGTGQPFGEDFYECSVYINTTVTQSAPYVWHWFYQVVSMN